MGALNNIKVLDLSIARAGPCCVRVFSDMGAEVIQVVRPRDTNVDSNFSAADSSNLHRNKRSVAIDLQTEEGHEAFMRLAEKADVIVENFRADVKHRLRIDYDSIAKVNPGIVYGSISGFGQDGPYRNRPGVDQIAQGLSGIMSVTGPPGTGPWRVGIAVCDMTAGLYLAHGLLGALVERATSGKGQWVHTSLLEAAIAMLDFQAMRWLANKEVPEQNGNEHPTGIPTGVFKSADGLVNLSATSDKQFRDFVREIGMPELLEDERFKDRVARRKNRELLRSLFEDRIREWNTDELVQKLNDAGVPAGPILTIDQMFADPQVQHLGMGTAIDSEAYGKVPVVRSPFNLTRTPATLRTAAPVPGEHTREVLREYGYEEPVLAGLAQRGVIPDDD
jgi:formyl-CoA transferase